MKKGIAEIDLIGTGGGYGESIIIHLGNEQFIIVDSCVDPKSRESLTLRLIKKKSIDTSKVVLIVCTHWHSDHITGLSKVLEECKNAKFVFAHATDIEKFYSFLSHEYLFKEKFNSTSTKEFNKCLDILLSREQISKRAQYDQLLHADSKSDIKVWSLSPSEEANKNFDLQLSELMENFSKSNKVIPKLSPNDKSVVLFIELGEHSVILGADLEVNNSNDRLGWLDIIKHSEVMKQADKSDYFKIPHHGSKNGFHEEIFSKLLVADPIGTLTPYNRHSIPNQEMIKLYKEYCKELHSTSKSIVAKKPKIRDRETTKALKTFNNTIAEIRFNYGVVNSKIDINDPDSEWETKHFDTALKL